MKISEATYRKLTRLFEAISLEKNSADEIRSAAQAVGNAITVKDGVARIERNPEVASALRRLTAELPASDALQRFARQYFAPTASGEAPLKKPELAKIYGHSPTLQNIPQKMLEEEGTLVAFLLARRDKIALENLSAAGEENTKPEHFAELSLRYSVADLVRALFAGGALKGRVRQEAMIRGMAEPIDYFLGNRSKLEPEIRRLTSTGGDGAWSSLANKALFVRQEGNSLVTMSDDEIDNVVGWGQWIMSDPFVSLRSLFRGDEISYTVLTNHKELLSHALPGTLDRFEDAAWMAEHHPEKSRKEAVAALSELVDQLNLLAASGFSFKSEETNWILWLKTVLSWNEDALHAVPPADERTGRGACAPPSKGAGSKGVADDRSGRSLESDTVEKNGKPGRNDEEELYGPSSKKRGKAGASKKYSEIERVERSLRVLFPMTGSTPK